jgi:ribonuclease I
MKQVNLIPLCSLAVLFSLFSVSESSLLNDESQIAAGSTLSESITLGQKSGLRKRDLLSNSSSDNVFINGNEKDQFDFYVLSMSYQPEFCYQHRRESFPGCEHPNGFWKESLTMHGLWPQVSG